MHCPPPSSQALLAFLITGAVATAQAQPTASSPSAPPPLRLAGPLQAPGNGILRATLIRGEVLVKRGTNTQTPVEEVLTTGAPIAAYDEVATKAGTAQLSLLAGGTIELGVGSLVAVVNPTLVYLARGTLTVASPPRQPAANLVVATPAGRVYVKGNEVTLSVDNDAVTIAAYDGGARLATAGAGVLLPTGQSVRWQKGAPPLPPKPLLGAPDWQPNQGLHLVDPQRPGAVRLSWQSVTSATRYRLELTRTDGNAMAAVPTLTEVTAPVSSADLRSLGVGTYLARLRAVDDYGAGGRESLPQPVVVAGISGLSDGGFLETEPGRLPMVTPPPGLTATLRIDGRPPTPQDPRPGSHRLLVQVGSASAEVPLRASGAAQDTGPVAQDEPHQPAPVLPPPRPTPTAPTPTARATSPVPTPLSIAAPAAVSLPPLLPAPEDVLFSGVGEVPLDGIRSPWAGRLVTARIEATVGGTLRLAAFGRYTMKNGFGADLGVSLLRASTSGTPEGVSAVGFGNLTAAVRTPALRRSHVALQGIVAAALPLSTSVLDTSVEIDGYLADEHGAYRPDVRPRGGGWRVEPGVLLGFRAGLFSVLIQNAATLRIAPGFLPGYAGGISIQADLVRWVRFISFAQWHVNYLGDTAQQVAMDADKPLTLEAGGAAGGGFEGFLGHGRLGQFRLALLGRAGFGESGVGVYGRAAFSLTAGYSFR